jgi:hypothetical protein
MATSTGAAQVSCDLVSPADTQAVTSVQGTLTWASKTYSLLVNSGGWQVYQLPEDALPWGIATSGRHAWFVDSGRQVLGKVLASADVSACKVEDRGGDLNTTDDQKPVANWTVYLSIDGERQTPGKSTDGDGCYTWTGLNPGVSYGVEEDVPDSWTALTPTSHDFGPVAASEAHVYTFVNSRDEQLNFLPIVQR